MSPPASQRPAATAGTHPIKPSVSPDGPTDEFTRIYLSMLRQRVTTRHQLLQEGFSAEEIDTLTETLISRGLVRRGAEDQWEMVPPEQALPTFAARLEEFARVLRASTPELARLHRGSALGDKVTLTGYEQLDTIADVGEAVQDLLASATSWVHGMRANTAYTRRVMRLPLDVHSRPITNSAGKPLRSFANFDTTLLQLPECVNVMTARHSAGEQIRMTSKLPFSITVNDIGHAVADIDAPAGEGFGLRISAEGAGEALARLVGWAWDLGVPWTPRASEATLGERELALLRLLAGGASDATIARQLGISQRTVERRVRAAMDHLNATTRFQAGVAAAQQGLI